MHKKQWIIGLLLISATLTLYSKDIRNAFLRFDKPVNFPEPVYHFATNPLTEAKFALGRKLFYEPRLSRDNTVSCGSCHIQAAGFTQHGHDVSHGIDDRLGSRNSPALINLAWGKSFFWDGGVFDLDLQPLVPITNPVEMDETMGNVLNKLRAHPDYPALFEKAFGTAGIDGERFMKALSQFMVMLVSSNSKYDKVIRQEGATFTQEEQAGYTIFKQKCGTCHTEPLFTDESFRNNGIRIGSNNDEGRFKVTLREADKYTFKVPTLRNLGFTAPYMHDGRFLTLDAVLEHYTRHVQLTPNLDAQLKRRDSLGIGLSKKEQVQVMAFLKTLNDTAFIADRRFSEQ
jgi:cytochrome c peroxidase